MNVPNKVSTLYLFLVVFINHSIMPRMPNSIELKSNLNPNLKFKNWSVICCNKIHNILYSYLDNFLFRDLFNNCVNLLYFRIGPTSVFLTRISTCYSYFYAYQRVRVIIPIHLSQIVGGAGC